MSVDFYKKIEPIVESDYMEMLATVRAIGVKDLMNLKHLN